MKALSDGIPSVRRVHVCTAAVVLLAASSCAALRTIEGSVGVPVQGDSSCLPVREAHKRRALDLSTLPGTIAFIRPDWSAGSSAPRTDVYTVRPDGSHQRRVTSTFSDETGVAVSSDGRSLAWSAKGDTADLVILSPAFGTRSRMPAVLSSPGTDDFQPAWSPDGRRLAFVRAAEGKSSQIAVLDVATRSVVPVTQPPTGYFDGSPAWTPDGRTIVFARNAYGEGWARLMKISANGSNLKDISPFPGDLSTVRVSPNGRSLVFGYECFGNWDIYTMSIDGQRVRRLTDSPGDDLLPAWSPDGLEIAFSSGRTDPRDPTSVDLYVMRTDGSGQTRLPVGPGGNAAWGPDP